MALINCKECAKPISDEAAVCCKCGYPMSSSKKSSSGCVITVGVIWFVILAIIVGAVWFFTTKNKNAKEYTANLNNFNSIVLSGANGAEYLGILIEDVWRNTIQKKYDSRTNKYTLKEGSNSVFNDSFDDSLARFFQDENIKDYIKTIESTQEIVQDLYLQLQNPSDEFKVCYDLVDSLYDDYMRLTNLVISPTGSLNSYSDEFRYLRKVLLEKHKKLDLLIPNE